jgi:putative ubiquitin-RnfH superfamily antitoxin RatB of RatAB toxin-antitoxin module
LDEAGLLSARPERLPAGHALRTLCLRLLTPLFGLVPLPLENEDDDCETLSVVEDVTLQVLNETSSMQEGYTSQMVNNERRSAGVILLLGEIVHQAIAQRDLLNALLQVGTAALGVVGKQRHVSKIEMLLDGDRILIEDPEKATVQTLLALFDAKHAGVAERVTSSSKLQITGKVSTSTRPSSR